MGVVYKALQCRASRLVALKMIRGDANLHPEQLERFRVEAQAVARLHHPNVVQIFDVGEFDGRPYFSLELLEGGTLKERLATAPLAPRPAAELLMVLSRAVEAAHHAGIIHRDLKPSNVLFDAHGTPKVADFGLAKRLESEEVHTLTGQVVGTPSYMSPEQARGDNRAVGPSADIYALGAVLYEMLTGRPPFKGTSASETLMSVAYQDPVAPSRFRPKVPRDLETICLKCLAKVPARRYPTTGELADDLERYLSGKPVWARRTPAWERAAKWARRRPGLAMVWAIVCIASFVLPATIVLHEASVRKHARLEDERVTQERLKAIDALDTSNRQRARGEVLKANLTLSNLLTRLEDEPRLADLRRRAEDVLRDVERQIAEGESRAANLERLARFRQFRDEALFRDAQFAGPGHEVHQQQTRSAARAALAVFAAAGGEDGAVPGPLPASLSPEQRAEVVSGCYWMLMVLSDAVARPLPGEDRRRQADTALRALDLAATLHAPTLAYHLRRAACLERRDDPEAARLERARAMGLEPTEAFDHLLLGQERSRRGDWDAARAHFEAAVRARPDLFWGHCLLAIADLNSAPPLAAEARATLTTCLLQQPSSAWLYLLRGTADSQMGAAHAAARQQAAGRHPVRGRRGRFPQGGGAGPG